MSTDASLGSSLPPDSLTQNITVRHKSMSLDLDNLSQTTELTTLAATDAASSRVRRSTRSSSLILGTDVQVVVAWLESFEDFLTFPVGEFSAHSSQVLLRFGLWLTVCTLNIDLLTYLLTHVLFYISVDNV